MPRRPPGRSAQAPSSREVELAALLGAAELRAQEAERREAAARSVLNLVADRPLDLGALFARIADEAVAVCKADDAVVYRVVGDEIERVAHRAAAGDLLPESPVGARVPITRGGLTGRAVADRTVVRGDLPASGEYDEERLRADGWSEAAIRFGRTSGIRTQMAVPMLRGGAALGAVTVRRWEAV